MKGDDESEGRETEYLLMSRTFKHQKGCSAKYCVCRENVSHQEETRILELSDRRRGRRRAEHLSKFRSQHSSFQSMQ